MNTRRISSKVMLSFYEYSCAIELDCSHVIILTYELVYSLYVMILTCATLCLTIHMTYMSRSRAKLRWRFIVPSGLPMSYACWSVGSEPRGDMGSFFVQGMVLGCTEAFGYDSAPWLRDMRQMVQPCLSLLIPHVQVLCRSLKVSRACWQTNAQRSPRPSYT
jgi:hypothetical protein